MVQALFAKGVPIGTLLALMMSVVGLSLPEFIILRKVLKPRLILIFAGVVATGILVVGYLINLVLSR
ncbi:MAG: putative permease [bacterium ADurb.Bin429]|nr:MAG: putative permease [bacterium ADurb.Bin429]